MLNIKKYFYLRPFFLGAQIYLSEAISMTQNLSGKFTLIYILGMAYSKDIDII